MAEIVRRAPPDFCKILHLVPHAPQEIRVVYGRSAFIAEYPFFRVKYRSLGQNLLLSLRAEPYQFRGEFRAHIYSPLRRGRLGRFYLPVVRDIPLHDDIVVFEVDVLPL